MKKAGLTALILLLFSLPLFSANKIRNFSGTYQTGKAVLSWSHDTYTNIQSQRLYRRDLFSSPVIITNLGNIATAYNSPVPDPDIFYYYKLVLVASDGTEINPSNEVEISASKSPEKYDLIRFMDNTLSLASATQIKFYYGIPIKGVCEVAILNVNRELIKVIASGTKDAGTYLGTWDGKNMAGKPVLPGLYILAVNTSGGREAKRIIVKP